MKAYAFFRHDNTPGVHDFELEFFADDFGAEGWARRMIARDGHPAVDIWDGDHLTHITPNDRSLRLYEAV